MSGPETIPCLLVDDVHAAADYYCDVLGFDRVEILGEPPVAAMARRREGAVLLQQASARAGRGSQRGYGPQAWDAVLYVADLDAEVAAMAARGAHVQTGIGLTHLSERTFEVRDKWGNMVAFAATPAGVRARAARALRAAVPTVLRVGVRDRRLARLERPHLAEFREFYERLPDKRDVFYMFFAEGLLHWVVNATRLVPPEVNLVLIGSALPTAEQEFIRAELGRPFHNIRLGVDDNTAWEYLFATNRHNFGYLDIDCFVLEPALFAEMAAVEAGVAVNAIWTYEAAPGVPIGCTHFAFVNVPVIEALRSRDRLLSPTNYNWAGSDLPFLHNRTYCRVPTRHQRRLLLELLPPDERGRPEPPGQAPFFDTLVAYQVVASASGYPTHPVRALRHRTQATLADLGPDGTRVWQQDVSDELVHVGGVSYYWKFFHLPQLRTVYLAAERAMLSGAVDRLPPYYARRLGLLDAELAQLGIDGLDATDLVVRHLVQARGLSESAAERILGTSPAINRP